jgi:hypothetical protein
MCFKDIQSTSSAVIRTDEHIQKYLTEEFQKYQQEVKLLLLGK